MATAGLTEDVLRAETLAVVTAFDTVNARQVRELIRKKWGQLGVQLKNGLLLFIMGIHGLENGTLGSPEPNIKTMQNQVSYSSANLILNKYLQV